MFIGYNNQFFLSSENLKKIKVFFTPADRLNFKLRQLTYSVNLAFQKIRHLHSKKSSIKRAVHSPFLFKQIHEHVHIHVHGDQMEQTEQVFQNLY